MRWRLCVRTRVLAVMMAGLMVVNAASLVQAQVIEGQRQEQDLGVEQEVSAAVEPRTTIIPSLRLAERYDSNVFFVPGQNLEDYVTTVSPQVSAIHRNQWVEAKLGAGATGEVYVKNPGLNYVGGNGAIDLNLDRAVNSLVRGAGLRISDTLMYTPQPPAFAAPTGGSEISEAFVQGIQARRANSFTNVATVEASYFFSSFMGVTSTYTDRRIRFGTPRATPTGVEQGGVRDTDFQTLISGVLAKVSSSDTVSLLHQYQKGTISDPDRGETGFSTQGALMRWSRAITQTLQATGEGGFSMISPNNDVYPVGAATLKWEEQYTTVGLSYSQGIAPSFFAVSAPLLSRAVTGTIRRQISEAMSASLSGSYAVNQSVPDSSLIRFESYSVAPSLDYKIGQSFTVRLSYTRSEFQRTFSGQSFDFDRNMVMFSLLSEWR